MAHDDLVCPPPVSPCDHPARRLALCAFHAQLSRRRRSARGARSGCLLRNGAAMGLEFGPLFARELRRRRPRPTSRWHLDEMAVMIAGRQFWLWRAVDDEGEVLDLLVQRRRDKAAAVKLMRKLLKKQGFAPDVLVTDKLRSYGAAKSEIGLSARHDQGLRTEQSGREFASTDTTARAQDAAVQIARISPTLLVRSRRRPKHFQRPAPSHIPPHAPRPPRGSLPYVASRHRGLNPNWAFQSSHGQIQFA